MEPSSSLHFDPESNLLPEFNLPNTPYYSPTLYAFLHNSPFTHNYILPIPAEFEAEIIQHLHTALTNNDSSLLDALFKQTQDQKTEETEKLHTGKACGYVFKKGEAVYSCYNCGLDATCVFCSKCFYASDHEGHETKFHVSQGNGGCCDCGDAEAWKVPINCKYHSQASSSSLDTDEKDVDFPDLPSKYVLTEAQVEAMKTAISTVLDFIIDTLSGSQDTPTTPDSIEQIIKNNPVEVFEKDFFIKNWSSTFTSLESSTEDICVYSLVLWNDEVHSFNEVIATVCEVLEISPAEGKLIAERIDAYGREVIDMSTSAEKLFDEALKMDSVQLCVSVRSSREIFREGLAGLLINWLKDLPKKVEKSIGVHLFENEYISVEFLLRRLLCAEFFRPRRNIKERVLKNFNDILTEKEHFSGALENEIISSQNDPGWKNVLNKYFNIDDIMDTEENEHEWCNIHPRIDSLLSFDSGLWKEARLALRELYISTVIVSGDHYKKLMAIRYAYMYPILTSSYLSSDREHELSIVTFSVQLFSVPTIVEFLVKQTPIVPIILKLLKTYFIGDTVAPGTRSIHYPKLNCEGDAIKSKRYSHIIHDLNYFFNAKLVQTSCFRFGTGDVDLENRSLRDLDAFLDFLVLLQGMNPQQRQLRSHVEYEADSWYHCFNLTLYLQEIISSVANCFSITSNGQTQVDFKTLLHALQRTIFVIDNWSAVEQLEENGKKSTTSEDLIKVSPLFHKVAIHDAVPFLVGRFKVSKQPVSFHHNLHWFLARLLSNIPRLLTHLPLDAYTQTNMGANIWSMLFFSFNSPISSDSYVNIESFIPSSASASTYAFRLDTISRTLRFFEPTLRVAALLAQIKAGVWVRNGYSMRAQAMNYREAVLRDCLDLDCFLLQVAATVVLPDYLLITFVDRFELVDWFKGVSHPDPTDEHSSKHLMSTDANQLGSIVEDFLQLLIIILTQRSRVAGVPLSEEIKIEIIHGLATNSNGLSYSELTKRISDRLVSKFNCSAFEIEISPKSFDAVLSEVSVFKFPEGTADHGLYELKPEFYDQVDPWFWHYSRNERVDIEKLLKSKRNIAKSKKASSSHAWDLDSHGDVILPILLPLPIGLDRIDRLVDSVSFVQIVFFSLYNVSRNPIVEAEGESTPKPIHPPLRNDTVFSAGLHLIIVALELEKSSGKKFSQLLCNCKIKVPVSQFESVAHETTLLNLLLSLLERGSEDSFISEYFDRLKYIVKHFAGHEVVTHWKIELSKNIMQESEEVDDFEKKRAAAKARKAAIMQQFTKAQETFMHNFEDDLDEIEDEDGKNKGHMDVDLEEEIKINERKWAFPSGTCIVCQEEVNKDSTLYAMLGFVQPSYIQRHVDFSDVNSIKPILATPSSLDVDRDEMNHKTSSSLSQGIPTWLSTAGLCASSCGHLMHFKCFHSYNASLEARHQQQPTRNHPENLQRKEFLCPLCKGLGNCLLPVFWTEKTEVVNLHGSRVFKEQRTIMEMSTKEVIDDFDKWWSSGISSFVKGICETNSLHLKNRAIESASEDLALSSRFKNLISGFVSHLISSENNSISSVFDIETAPPPSLPGSFPTRSTPSPPPVSGADASNRREVIAHIARFSSIIKSVYRDINPRLEDEDAGLHTIDLLWECIGYSITSIEIMSRGTGAYKYESTFKHTVNKGLAYVGVLDSISQQNLTLLRVLSETILTYTSLSSQSSSAGKKLNQRCTDMLKNVFYGCEGGEKKDQDNKMIPCLMEDGFSLLVETSMNIIPLGEMNSLDNALYWVEIFWVLEIVKVVVAVVESVGVRGGSWAQDLIAEGLNSDSSKSVKGKEPVDEAFRIMEQFVMGVLNCLGVKDNVRKHVLEHVNTKLFILFCKRNSLPYMRKAVILLFARFGIVPPSGKTGFDFDQEERLSVSGENFAIDDEFERLRCYLRLPSLTTACSFLSTDDSIISNLISGWLDHLKAFEPGHFSAASVPVLPSLEIAGLSRRSSIASCSMDITKDHLITLASPIVFDLIDLPDRLDILFEESLKRVCKKCNAVPTDPALCLLCGLFVCSQTFCCTENDLGECNTHTKLCGGDIGVFLVIKKCIVLLLHNQNGAFMNPPYLDSHGEVDLGIRRGRPLFLNHKRYNEIRKLWLSNGIPSYVARKVEMTFDFGGWRTM